MKKTTKKISVVLIVSLLILSNVSAVFATDTTRFSIVQEYNGQAYVQTNTWYLGEIFNTNVKTLPISVNEECGIYGFCFYNDRIYYLIGSCGTYEVLGYIYSCNLDGTDTRLIADNAAAVGANLFISDGCLYYEILNDTDNSHNRMLNGGIMKINLNTNDYCRIITDSSARLEKVLGDNVFYRTGPYPSYSYHLMKTSGAYIGTMSPYDIEIESDIIEGNYAYHIDGSNICKYNWDNIHTAVCSVTPKVKTYDAYLRGATIVNTSNDYIYYTMYFYDQITKYITAPNKALLRAPKNGGQSELISWWYVS